MTGTRTDFLETLRDSYSAYYDIHENESFTGLPRVKPHKEHQYTNIAAIFVAESFDPATAKHIAKRSFSKSYKFSLHGYTELLTAAVELGTESTRTNPAGRPLEAYFRKLFAARR